jgi:hypothetical protein
MEETIDYIYKFITGLSLSREPTATKEVYPCNYEELASRINLITNDKNVSKSFRTLVKTLRNDMAVVRPDTISSFREYLEMSGLLHEINKIGHKRFFDDTKIEFINVLDIIGRYISGNRIRDVEYDACGRSVPDTVLCENLLTDSTRKVYATYILFWLFFNIKYYTNPAFSNIVSKILFFLFMNTGKKIVFKPYFVNKKIV